MDQARRGFMYGVAAYGLWGFIPLYFKLLAPAAALEILGHRIVWSVGFMSLVLLVMGGWEILPQLARQPRKLLGTVAAAALIGCNWAAYIYSVVTDRVVEASLGYFITPLVTVLLGVLVLRELLRPAQWLALAISGLAVTVLTVDYGRVPYLALTLASCFGLYGLVKKKLGLPVAEGLFVEALVLAPPALAFLWWLAARGETVVGTVSAGHTALVVAAGAVTAVPLMLFAGAANRIPLSALGILQYLAPVLQFSLGVLVFREPMPPARLAGFALVWLALAIFTAESLRHARQRARPRRPTAAGHPTP